LKLAIWQQVFWLVFGVRWPSTKLGQGSPRQGYIRGYWLLLGKVGLSKILWSTARESTDIFRGTHVVDLCPYLFSEFLYFSIPPQYQLSHNIYSSRQQILSDGWYCGDIEWKITHQNSTNIDGPIRLIIFTRVESSKVYFFQIIVSWSDTSAVPNLLVIT